MDGPGRATLFAFAGAIFIGGTNFVAVKLSNEALPPMFGAMFRFAIAAAIFFVLMLALRLPLPKGRAALGAALYGVLGFGLGYASLYYALVGLSPQTSSVIMASTPLATLTLAVLHRQERFSTRGLIGGVLAVAGIAVLSGDALDGSTRPIYMVAALVGMLATAESSVLVKGFPNTHPITTNFVGMTAGSVFLALASLAFRESWALPDTAMTWGLIGYLTLVGSVGLFILFLFVISRWTASASVYALTMMPVVAVTLSVLLLDEPLRIEVVIGAVLVLGAVYIGALSQPKPPAPAMAAERA